MSSNRLTMNAAAGKIKALALALLSLSSVAWSVDPSQIRIPARSATPAFSGQSGKQRSEIHFDPASNTVTIKLQVQDPEGHFIPNIRRENFVVYENAVRQKDAAVDIEHAPVSIALLMEHGGRYPGLNKFLVEDVSRASHQLLAELGTDDKLSVWRYADHLQQVAGFSQGRDKLDSLFYTLEEPPVSETNLYDALISLLGQMQPVAGRKAIFVISSGVDTFSKSTYQDALNAARNSTTPIYAISLAPSLRDIAVIHGDESPATRIDWNRAVRELFEIARASGGRGYSPSSTVDLSPFYDDAMENLRLRYVITYRSSSQGNPNSPRAVRVELVDPKTGRPLQIVDTNGKIIRANVIVQDSYTPSRASTAGS